MRKSVDSCRRANERDGKWKGKSKVASWSADAQNSTQCLPCSRGSKAKKEHNLMPAFYVTYLAELVCNIK